MNQKTLQRRNKMAGPLMLAIGKAWASKDALGKAKSIFKLGGQIKGFFGGRRDERNRRAQQRMYRNFANESTQNLMNLIPEEREYASQRAGFLRQRGELKQAAILDKYEMNFDKIDSGVAKTGMAYGADENIRKESLLDAFQQQSSISKIAGEEQYLGIQRDFQTRIRNIEASMEDVKKYAADKGVVRGVKDRKISTQQKSTNFGGY